MFVEELFFRGKWDLVPKEVLDLNWKRITIALIPFHCEQQLEMWKSNYNLHDHIGCSMDVSL